MTLGTPLKAETLLKRTSSRCPVCHAACPAEVWRVGDAGAGPAQVFLKRTCPAHGEASVCIASDARFYWLARGNPDNAQNGGCCGSACCASDGSAAGTLGRNAAGRGDGPIEKLATCLALIEIVNSCNLSCPTCYADSPQGTGANVDAVPLAELQSRIQGVIDRKGSIEILQLSGGEPTLHPQLFELLEWARAHPRIDYVLLNTNGVRLANEPDFAARLGELFARGGLQIYLQFDGVQEAGQRWLRGADLRELRERAIDRCAAANIPVTLAMTVTRENLPHLWETIEFGLARTIVHGVTFQPMFGSGRVPEKFRVPGLRRADSPPGSALAEQGAASAAQAGSGFRVDSLSPAPSGGEGVLVPTGQLSPKGPPLPSPLLPRREEREATGREWEQCQDASSTRQPGTRNPPARPKPLRRGEGPEPGTRLNTADILLAAVGQSGGRLRFDDFTPLPCGDPNCATIGYLIRHGGRTWPVSDFVDFRRVQGFLQDKVHYTIEDLARCGCENEPLGELLKGLELKASMTFRLMVKPFMDAWTWDQDRIDRCCTHVIRPDGKLDSFCRYYSGFSDAQDA